jgi:hypothetical protein
MDSWTPRRAFGPALTTDKLNTALTAAGYRLTCSDGGMAALVEKKIEPQAVMEPTYYAVGAARRTSYY